MSQRYLKATKVLVLFALCIKAWTFPSMTGVLNQKAIKGICSHSSLASLMEPDVMNTMLDYLETCFSALSTFPPCPSPFFHITIQRKMLESKKVLCFYSKYVRNQFFSNIELPREGNSAGFLFTFRRLKENHDYDGQRRDEAKRSYT